MKARKRQHRGQTARGKRGWVRTVTTVSTAPPRGLFTKNARTIARTLASPRVSPKGVTSGLRMLMFFINRAGKGLSGRRRAELFRAKRLMQAMIAKEHRDRFVSPS
jgi:Protein of unknown function (DUF3175)